MDKRSSVQRALWDRIGPPLYYCEDCLLAVKVTPVAGQEPVIERPCKGCNCQIIAPRTSILAGEGGLSHTDRMRQLFRMIVAVLTRRTI